MRILILRRILFLFTAIIRGFCVAMSITETGARMQVDEVWKKPHRSQTSGLLVYQHPGGSVLRHRWITARPRRAILLSSSSPMAS